MPGERLLISADFMLHVFEALVGLTCHVVQCISLFWVRHFALFEY